MQERAFGPVAILSRAVATAVALAVASLLLAAPPAVAYETFGTYHLTYGIVNQLYWVDATASDHEGGIDTGITRWNGTSTPFAYTQTSAKASSRMDFYKMSTVQSWWGKTYRYVNTTQLAAPPNQNWWWVKIQLDADFANCPNKIGTIAHEIGHGLGLDHMPAGSNALMRYDLAAVLTNVPLQDDVNGVNHLY